MDCGYRIVLIIADRAVEKILLVHVVQLMTYLRLSHLHVGLLINFNVAVLRQGIVRRVR
jgi:GxxExxY protein